MNTTHFRITTPHLFKRIFQTNPRQIISDLLSHMTVQKILILASLLIILLFDVFHLFTDPTFMAPVGSMGFEIGRVLVAVLLLFLLFTDPPRSLKVRSALGAASFVMFVVALQSLFAYQIGIIDCVLYLEVAIIVGLEALEPQRRVRVTRYTNAQFNPAESKG
jgi:hypothetical protein